MEKSLRGLSAGRVQSVTVKLVVEREREREKFQKQEYWSITANLEKPSSKESFEAKLHKINNEVVDKFAVAKKLKLKILSTLENSIGK